MAHQHHSRRPTHHSPSPAPHHSRRPAQHPPEEAPQPPGGTSIAQGAVEEPDGSALRPRPKLRCPNCAQLVTLPATECPACRTDLRTGLAPKDEGEFMLLRRAQKVLSIFGLAMVPILVLLLIGYSQAQEKAKAVCYAVLKLEVCAPERDLLREFIAMTQAKLQDLVRAGYQSWTADQATRVVEGKKGQEFSAVQAQRDYYTATRARLDEVGLGPARSAPDGAGAAASDGAGTASAVADLLTPFLGEWDVIWIEYPGTPQEKVAAGEWIFSTIVGGLAVEDILTVPPLFQTPAADGPAPLRFITLRQFNSERGTWDGVTLQPDGLRPVQTLAAPGGGLREISVDSRGVTTTRSMIDRSPESFRLRVNSTPASPPNAPAQLVGELWAKKRAVVTP